MCWICRYKLTCTQLLFDATRVETMVGVSWWHKLSSDGGFPYRLRQWEVMMLLEGLEFVDKYGANQCAY